MTVVQLTGKTKADDRALILAEWEKVMKSPSPDERLTASDNYIKLIDQYELRWNERYNEDATSAVA